MMESVRSRFDAAHELAHLILHRNIPSAILEHRPSFNLIEEQANLFAGAFLLPAASFGNEYVAPSLAALKELKKKWRVSVGTLIARAVHLGQISKDQATRLWINRSRQGWHRREPFDDEWEPERPVLISKSVRLMIEAGVVSRVDLLAQMQLFPEDVETIAGLPSGYLREPVEESPEVPGPRLLPFRPKDSPFGKVN